MHRELQHSGSLARAEMREQYDPTIRELERVVVRTGIIYVHLSKALNCERSSSCLS